MKFLEFSRVQATALLLTVAVSATTANAATFRTAGRASGHASRDAVYPGYAKTMTQGLTDKLVNATDLGLASPSMPMHLEIGLTTNRAAIDAAVAAIYTPGNPAYQQFISPAQFTATFSPSQATANAVASFLAQAGFSNVAIAPNRLVISASGTAAIVDSAFKTNIHMFNLGGRAIFANQGAAQVPTAISGAVQSVLGLNSIGMQTFHKRSSQVVVQHSLRRVVNGRVYRDFSPCVTGTTVPVCALNTYFPTDLAFAYDGAGQLTASSAHVAIFTEGNLSQTKSDLAQALTADGQSTNFTVQEKDVLGAATDTSGTDEWDIDSQSSTGMSGGVRKLTFYNGTSLQSDSITATFNQFALDGSAALGNASFGGCETLSYVEGEMATDDVILAETAMQGQSVFVSSGDGGSQCSVAVNPGAPVGIPDVEYPASSPYVTAVGGTSLLTNAADDSYYGEITWVNGGGGISLFETASPWQKANITLAATTLRLVPDVTMDADPNVSGMNTVVSGAYSGYGGTSLASPMTMGTFARLITQHGRVYGEAAAALYVDYNKVTANSMGVLPKSSSLAVSPAYGGFHDVIAGTNSIYQATPGFDLTSGIGSLDIKGILADFASF